MFAFEVEFLTGTSVAATPYSKEEVEWPPHPDRLFQALVAAWGRNDPPDGDECKALEWLEALDMNALAISVPKCWPRDVVTVYVPPNDAETKGRVGATPPKKISEAIRVVPDFRKNRQQRAFPAIVLPMDNANAVRYVWRLDERKKQEFAGHRAVIARLAREVTYLGHSHSPVRAALIDGGDVAIDTSWFEAGPVVMRFPYRGRLKELVESYRRSLRENRVVRPIPSLATRIYRLPVSSTPATLFETDNVMVFADAGGFVPTLAAFPLVAKRLRDALLKCSPADAPIPTLLSGHDDDRRPAETPHVAVVPLGDVGWTYSQGRLMGLALVWPREVSVSDRRSALKIIASFLKDGKGKVGLLHFGRDGSWSLALEPEPTSASLLFDRYTRPARRWGSVLPAALDRHPKDKAGEELADIITRACLNIGLPKEAIDGLDIEVHKYSPLKGAPSVKEVFESLPADSPYRTKPFAHLVLTFPRPVCGPLILGAGRFRGLGLCLPLDGDDMP